MQKTLTIIDSKSVRGIVAPTANISRETLEDMVDLVELSSKKEARKTAARLKSADRKKSWVPLSALRPRRS